MPAGPPNPKLLDYWATLSRCLTHLEVSMDPTDKQQLLQPAYLNQLTRLTRLAFNRPIDPDGDAHEADGPHYALELPELEVLRLGYLWAGKLELQCPQLKRLTIEDCAVRKLHLQASLEHLHHGDNALALIHESFPITNLMGLTHLSLSGRYDSNSRAELFQALPLMTRLNTLDLCINRGGLPGSLPSSLQHVTLTFNGHRAWDSSVIPLVQQLPEAVSIYIDVHTTRSAYIGDQSLDHDLRPYLAMKSLRFLVLGSPRVWMPSALCQLGELEAEVVKTGKKLDLRY